MKVLSRVNNIIKLLTKTTVRLFTVNLGRAVGSSRPVQLRYRGAIFRGHASCP